LTVQSLALSHEGEVLAFLARRPLHTVIMAGSIRNNGLVNEKDQVAQACYHKAGYKQRGNYDTVSSQQQ